MLRILCGQAQSEVATTGGRPSTVKTGALGRSPQALWELRTWLAEASS